MGWENDCKPFLKRNSIITISLKCCPRFLPCIVSQLSYTLRLSSFPCTEIVEIGVDFISYVYIGTLVMIMLESENICICLLSCWRWKCSIRVGPITQSWPELVRHLCYLSMISWLVSSTVSKSKWGFKQLPHLLLTVAFICTVSDAQQPSTWWVLLSVMQWWSCLFNKNSLEVEKSVLSRFCCQLNEMNFLVQFKLSAVAKNHFSHCGKELFWLWSLSMNYGCLLPPRGRETWRVTVSCW